MGAGLERPHELGAVGDLLPEDADREVALDAGQAGGEHGAVATGAEPLTEPVSAQRQPSRLGEHQRRVMGEHPPFELRQRRRRLEAELLDEHPAVVAVHAECVGLATGAVEGDHQLRPERLAQLVLTGERLDLRDHLRRSAARQLGLDETLVGDDPQLLQPLRLRTGPLLVGELGVGLATPQRQRFAQHRRRPGRVAAPQPRTGVGDQALEAGDIERLARQPQHVPRRLRHHRRRRPVAVDHPAHPGHVAPQRRARRRRRLTGEHRLGEPVHRHHGVAMDQQHRHQPALPRPTDAHLIPVLGDGEPTQRVKLQHPPPAQRHYLRLHTAHALQSCSNPTPSLRTDVRQTTASTSSRPRRTNRPAMPTGLGEEVNLLVDERSEPAFPV